MNHLRKKREKKNLFDDGDLDEEENGGPPERKNDLYQAAKIQKNDQVYIRDNPDKEQEYQNQVANNKMLRSSKKKKLVRKQKNLFQSDEEDEIDENQTEDKQQSTKFQKKSESNGSNSDKGEIDLIARCLQNPPVANQTEVTQKVQKQSSNVTEKDDEIDSDEDNLKDAAKQKKQSQSQEEQEKNVENLFYSIGSKKEEMRELLFSPIKEGFKAELDFVRVPSGFSQSYRLMIKERNVLFCENQRGCIGANYYLSLTKDMDKKSQSYLGKLRGNSSGSTYVLYDDGSQPSNKLDRSQWRATLAKIEYQTNILGINGPRKLKAIAPLITSQQKYDCFKLDQNQDLTNFYPPNVIKLRNKQPRWNERLKSFALNFGGRVKLASIKNFIMVNDEATNDQEASAKNLLVFGKSDQNMFSLQVCAPLSIYQAFGIAMSSFDFKFNCQ